MGIRRIIVACLLLVKAYPGIGGGMPLSYFFDPAPKRIVVAADGSGDYKTVQAAFDAVPLWNKKPVVIYVKQGIYREKLHLDSGKNFVRLVGESRFNTVLT